MTGVADMSRAHMSRMEDTTRVAVTMNNTRKEIRVLRTK